MGVELIMALAVITFLILIALEVPIALAIAGGGLLGITLQVGPDMTARALGSVPFTSSAKYTLIVIPMYVLLGCLIANASIGERIFSAVNRFARRLPGGLAATAVGATALFSGISGSSSADVATFGRISVTEMGRHGYSRHYAAAVVAAAGAFAALIPPSIGLVIYGILAEVSIGAMILAGLLPGLISAVLLGVYVVVRAWIDERRGFVAGTAARPQDAQDEPDEDLDLGPRRSGIGADLSAMFYALVLFLIVVGGLYAGVFTASEAGAVGALAALVIAVLNRKYHRLSFLELARRSLTETANVTSMIFLLVIGGAIFSYALALSGTPSRITEVILGFDIPPTAVLAVVLLVLIPLGAFLDGLSIMLLTVPLIAPVAMELGFDGVWVGILVLKCVEIGLITPPVGVNAFIISGIMKIPVEKVFRALVPFVVLDLCVTALFFAFPEIILVLPRQAGLL